MLEILVLCSQYPNNEDYSRGQFFHVRNKYYCENGCNVDVLNFETGQDYCIENIKVFTEESVRNQKKGYDIILCHAPKLQQHFKYLKNNNNYKKIVYVFHGNEVLDTYKIAPYRYPYLPSAKLRNQLVRKIKDKIKLKLLNIQFRKYIELSHFVFVSEWMQEQMLYSVKLKKKYVEGRSSIIHNAVGKEFQYQSYDYLSPKKFDFICIRAQLDGAKYGVDIVNEIAKNNPDFSFLIIGKGDFFIHNKKSDNVTWIEKTLTHNEIIEYLNLSRCAILPTRWDSQGLLTCETATFGIPTITSDIPICYEMLDEFENVGFINNEESDTWNVVEILKELEGKNSEKKCFKFFSENTVKKEVDLFRGLSD